VDNDFLVKQRFWVHFTAIP